QPITTTDQSTAAKPAIGVASRYSDRQRQRHTAGYKGRIQPNGHIAYRGDLRLQYYDCSGISVFGAGTIYKSAVGDTANDSRVSCVHRVCGGECVRSACSDYGIAGDHGGTIRAAW